jgi:hypothetical protein
MESFRQTKERNSKGIVSLMTLPPHLKKIRDKAVSETGGYIGDPILNELWYAGYSASQESVDKIIMQLLLMIEHKDFNHVGRKDVLIGLIKKMKNGHE